MTFEGLVLAMVLLVTIFLAAMFWFKNNLKRRNTRIEAEAEKLMNQYKAEGKLEYYEKLEDEELLTIYRSTLEEDVSDDEEKFSENGVKSYIMEMELEKRGIEFRSIIDDVLSKL